MRLLLLTLLLLPSLAAAQHAGRFLLAAGEVFVVRGGATVRAALGTPVESGDVIRVGAASDAQIRMSDASIVALRPGTELRIDEYVYSGKPDADSKSFLSLVRGGLRTITGAIGSLHDRSHYEVRTPTASIGIRGTHYVLVQCDNDCPGSANGTYGGVSDGKIGVQNRTPEREFDAHEFFHVADASSPPEALMGPPDFLYDRLPAQERSPRSKGSESSEGMARSGLDAESRPSDVPAPPSPPAFVVTEQRDKSGNPVVIQTGVVVAAAAGSRALVGSFGGSQALDATVGAFEPGTELTMSGTALQSFRAPAGSSTAGAVSGDSGGNVVDETKPNAIGASWGYWSAGTYTDSGGTIPLSSTASYGNGQFHYLVAPLTPPEVIATKTGVLAYNFVFGTTPTNNLGELGTFVRPEALGVDFVKQSIAWPAANFSFPNQSWSFPTTTSPITVSSQGAYTQNTVIGGCGGNSCSGTVELTRTGVFLGPTGDHLGVSMAGRGGTDPTASMQAVGVYSCQPNC